MAVDLPLRKTMCDSCPFKKGSKYAYLLGQLTESSCHATRICHSTGNSAFVGETGIEEYICRGSRQFQLEYMRDLGVISDVTDKAWNEARITVGMKPTITKDPEE